MGFICSWFGHQKTNHSSIFCEQLGDAKIEVFYCKRCDKHILKTSEEFLDKIAFLCEISIELHTIITKVLEEHDGSGKSFVKKVLKIGEELAKYNLYTHLGLITPFSELFQVSGDKVAFGDNMFVARSVN